MSACSAFSRLNRERRIKLRPSVESARVVEYLADQARLHSGMPDAVAAVRAIRDAGIAADWAKLVESIRVLLRHPDNADTKMASALMELLIEIKNDCAPADRNLASLLRMG